MFYSGKIINFIGGIADVLIDDGRILKAKPKGIFRHNTSILKPVVGDLVNITFDHDSFLIVEIKERKNLLIRPKVANIDEIIIIQSLVQPDLNLYLLDKFLAHYESRVEKVSICFTKIDLLTPEQLIKIQDIINIYKSNGYTIYNSNSLEDINSIKFNLGHKTMCLVGNSGVGKSTLLNKINPDLALRTQEISKALNRGKHTTTNTQMILYDKGMFVDTPGFSSIEIFLTANELASSFHDFRNNARFCKFSNCLHVNEPGCKIKELVELNIIDRNRYNNYIKMQEEIKKNKKNTSFC